MALEGRAPDRLPATTHHVMPYFLDTYMGGMSHREFFDHFGLDAAIWIAPCKPNATAGDYFDPDQGEPGFLASKRIVSDNWRVESEDIIGEKYPTARFRIHTPKGVLTSTLQTHAHSSWVTERLIKERNDIDVIGEFATAPLCDVEAVNKAGAEFGERGLVRGHICCFEVYGQPGCWQDAACLVGIERLIMAALEDPQWVHKLLAILQRRKLIYVKSLEGAHYDVLELGGGDASSTVISPQIFDEFVAPYDAELIRAAHEAGQRIVYHTCGGMMPFLERIVGMNPDAMETFTPAGMGGDADLKEAKRRIGDKVCMIGGFDQGHFFKDCTPEQTKAEVRRCFEETGTGGGYILSPSDHFFDAEPALIQAYAEAARDCTY